MIRLSYYGFTYRQTPVELRERVVLTDDALAARVAPLLGQAGITEVYPLSTCNRTELYIVQLGDGDADGPVRALFAGLAGADVRADRDLERAPGLAVVIDVRRGEEVNDAGIQNHRRAGRRPHVEIAGVAARAVERPDEQCRIQVFQQTREMDDRAGGALGIRRHHPQRRIRISAWIGIDGGCRIIVACRCNQNDARGFQRINLSADQTAVWSTQAHIDDFHGWRSRWPCTNIGHARRNIEPCPRSARIQDLDRQDLAVRAGVLANGCTGILFPSQTHEGGTNLVVFPEHLKNGNAVIVSDPDGRLPHDQTSWAR